MVVYLDFNAHKVPSDAVLNEFNKWSVKGNPSSAYNGALDCNDLISAFKSEICDQYKMTNTEYTILFTSGASESNSHILSAACRAFIRKVKIVPHVITSNVEHDSINYALDDLGFDSVTFTKISVLNAGSNFGSVPVDAILQNIRGNTCLISIMYANNETGSINNIKDICIAASSKNIPVHTDAVQYAPREMFRPSADGICAFSLSFHKMGGPIGCGLLAIRNDFLNGYLLPPIIYGSQQSALRGGTIPIALIAASRAAFLYHYAQMLSSPNNIAGLRTLLIGALSKIYKNTMYLEDYVSMNNTPDIVCVLLTSPNANTLRNTLLFSIYNKNKDICNVVLRKQLIDMGIIVSIGSACKTGQKKASHVLSALAVPPELYKGVLRVSMGDTTTRDDIIVFVRALNAITNNQ